MNKDRILGVRLGELTEPLKAFEDGTGVGGATVAKELMRAALDYFEEHGEYVTPMAVVPKRELAALKALAHREENKSSLRIAEPGKKYGKRERS